MSFSRTRCLLTWDGGSRGILGALGGLTQRGRAPQLPDREGKLLSSTSGGGAWEFETPPSLGTGQSTPISCPTPFSSNSPESCPTGDCSGHTPLVGSLRGVKSKPVPSFLHSLPFHLGFWHCTEPGWSLGITGMVGRKAGFPGCSLSSQTAAAGCGPRSTVPAQATCPTALFWSGEVSTVY